MKRMQVDRLEEGFAVLVDEAERCCAVSREAFGFALHEGDILDVIFDGDVPVSARFLAEETAARRAAARALMERLRKKT